MKKICSKCKEEKEIEEFSIDKGNKDGINRHCRECRKKYYKKNKEYLNEKKKTYYKKNKEKFDEKNKEYYKKNKEVVDKKHKEYYYNNKETVGARQRKYNKENKEKINSRSKKHYIENKEKINRRRVKLNKEKYKNDTNFRLRQVISAQINKLLKKQDGSKNKLSILKYLPYTIEELKKHLESLWENWMSWDNYGKYEEGKKKWNIDHIIPQSLLLYDSMEHLNFLKCWALENLRPLGIIENIKKGNKIIGDIKNV
jgi:hypothetical protein